MSAIKIYEEYVVPGHLPYLALFYNSQDMLESFFRYKLVYIFTPNITEIENLKKTIFSRVRSLLGANDNPNLQEFKASIRKLLFYNEITSSVFSNCEDNLNILTISSNTTSTKQTLDETNEATRGETNEAERDNPIDDAFEEIEEVRTNRLFENRSKLHSKEDVTIAYIAGTIEKKVETCRFGCSECQDVCKRVFTENKKIVGPFVYNIKTQKPCQSTYIICKYAHETLKEKMIPSNFDYKKTYELISERLDEEILFVQTDFSHDDEHKNYLVSFIIDEYIRSHGTYVAQCMTLEQQRILIRNENRKETHFKGQ